MVLFEEFVGCACDCLLFAVGMIFLLLVDQRAGKLKLTLDESLVFVSSYNLET